MQDAVRCSEDVSKAISPRGKRGVNRSPSGEHLRADEKPGSDGAKAMMAKAAGKNTDKCQRKVLYKTRQQVAA